MALIEFVIAWPLLALNAGALVLVLMYAAQLLAALLPRQEDVSMNEATTGCVAILVPAHDEEAGIEATLAAIRRAMGQRDRLLVVADNCSDATAIIAHAAGAEVIERHDLVLRGKGYALDAGIRHLALSPPDVLIIVDADCIPEPQALKRLADAASRSERPVQSLYLMTSPSGAPLSTKVSEFAFMLKNKVRQRGLHRLGLPCHLTGSGMAFPWATIKALDLADGHLAEDMKMGLELALSGYPPRFCEAAVVLSQFPETTTGLETQRGRWIKGHLSLLGTALRAIPKAIGQGNMAAALAAVATAIPPLTILILLLGVLFAISLVLNLLLDGVLASVVLSSFNLTLALAMTFIAWLSFGQQILPPRSASRAAVLILTRLVSAPLKLASSKGSGWIRTDRSRRNE